MVVRLMKGKDYDGDIPEDAEVYIHNTVPSATIDLSVGIVTRNTHGTAQTIKAKKVNKTQYTAIVVPQRLTNQVPLVEVVMKGVYADITVNCMRAFGIETLEVNGNYNIKGIQTYNPTKFTVEGDCSQAAFFAVANELGSSIELVGVNRNSVQGDRAVFDIIDKAIKINGNYSGFDIDASDIPDLVPVLTVLAAFAEGTSHIRGCKRLRIKESDRLVSISTVLNSLGADVKIVNDELEINGVKELSGGVCSSFNDHRIAMSLAVASQRCTSPLTITGAECVAKSYPTFFEDFRALGGEYDVVIV